ncbi:MAG: MBOAT family O-acyltransferase [Butyrivibrio sp.]
MVFSSLTFLFIFLPVVLILYYVCRDITWKNVILLISSLVFYAWGEPVYVLLMIISIFFNYFIGKDIAVNRHKKGVLIFGIAVNLLILGYFKYSGFLIDTINQITGLSIQSRELPLPIGISFYTFQAMSYIIDVYRGNSRAQQKILPFAVYITMFPQLIAGPIVRYEDIENQLNSRRFSGKVFGDGVIIFVRGLAKKVILANCIGALHTEILGITTRSASVAWIGAIAYTLQIFNDFSGYSDMAIGLGKMLGFEFPVNFNAPYRSLSVTEFWRRWHISLSTWFREYVYIPLGGNRKGALRQILNLLIVWFLTGLWHGASWNFVIWGMYYGILLILEKFVLSKVLDKIPKFIRLIITFIIVVIGWVFFFSNSITEAVGYLQTMFGSNGSFIDGNSLPYFAGYIALLVIGMIPAVIPYKEESALPKAFRWILCIALFGISITFLVSESYNPFLYFRF